MDNFVYCYLSPFLLGLLAVVAIFAGFILALAIICWVGAVIHKWFTYDLPTYGATKKIMGELGKWTTRIFFTLVVVMLAAIFAFGMWDMGIEILKRFACK